MNGLFELPSFAFRVSDEKGKSHKSRFLYGRSFMWEGSFGTELMMKFANNMQISELLLDGFSGKQHVGSGLFVFRMSLIWMED